MDTPDVTIPKFTAPGAKILVVDDLAINIRFIKELMNPYGIKTYACLNGARAVEMVQKERYDLIFMDMMMPEMDGLETISHIRELGAGDEYFRQLPIVLLSASEVEGQGKTLAQLGINYRMVKPIAAAKLFEVLERLLPSEKILPQN
ncbi:MAG: response regulator [Treponema sp.]|nr:response regulator [Treponema sp.]